MTEYYAFALASVIGCGRGDPEIAAAMANEETASTTDSGTSGITQPKFISPSYGQMDIRRIDGGFGHSRIFGPIAE